MRHVRVAMFPESILVPNPVGNLFGHKDGANGGPIWVAIKGLVFDVSAKPDMYGPGGSYHIFAGKDGSRALALGSLTAENAVPQYSDLGPAELKVLEDWLVFFQKRYPQIGKVSM